MSKPDPVNVQVADSPSRPSRRALLAAGLGTAVGFVASALGRPAPVRAGSDGDVVLGSFQNSTATTTRIVTTSSDAFVAETGGTGGQALRGTASGSGGVGVYGDAPATDGIAVWGVSGGLAVYGESGGDFGVYGRSTNSVGVRGTTDSASSQGVWGSATGGVGVYGSSTSSIGVSGSSSSWIGVAGSSGSNYGVYGEANGTGAGAIGVHGTSTAGVGMLGKSRAAAQPGAIGWSGGNSTGVQGISNANEANPPTPRAKTGVMGQATQDSSSRGVLGISAAGDGVRGEVTSGAAVHGVASGKAGYAFRGSGRLLFEKVSGVATIAANQSSVVVSPGTGLTTSSFVLLTAKSNIGSRSLYYSIDTTADTVTIHLSSTRSSSTVVAWLLLN